MIIGRIRLVGLLIFLAAVSTGCTETAEAASDPRPADVAVPAYAADAPHYCVTLAGSTHLTRIPAAVGTLAGGQADTETRADLTAAIDELHTVLDGVELSGGSAQLETVIGNLIEALAAAKWPAGGAVAHEGVAAGLDELGRLVQPVCGFPS